MKNNFVNKFIFSENGNALILVIFVSLCCTIIMGSLMYITYNQVKYSQAYKKTSNISYLAISGAEKAVSNMNKTINENIANITNEILNEMLNNISTINTENVSAYDNIIIYDSINSDSVYKINNDEFKKILKEKIYNITGDLLKFSYTAQIEGYEYKTNVDIKKEITRFNKDITYIVTSTTENIDTHNKYSVIGKISLDDIIKNEAILLEQYGWKNGSKPDLLSNAILSKGDIILKNKAKLNVYKSDILVGGSIPKYFGESDEYGGVYVLDGSKLTVEKNVYTASNIHTKRTYNKDYYSGVEKLGAEKSEIYIKGNAIANSISIEDNFSFKAFTYGELPYINYSPYNTHTMPIGHNINIGGNAYTNNDLNISRYVLDSNINVYGNFFGINSGDYLNGEINNPNNSSSIFNQGEGLSKINIGKAVFVNGLAFISFDDKKGFKKLAESVGKPYDDVYNDYIKEVSPLDKGKEWFESLANSNSVIKSEIIIGDWNNSIARGYISANEKSEKKETSDYNIVHNLSKLDDLLKNGIDNKIYNKHDLKQIDSKWEHDIINDKTALDIIFESGIEGYINKKLKPLYNSRTSNTIKDKNTQYELSNEIPIKLNKYNTIMLINYDNYNNENVEIDISQFYYDYNEPAPSAIIDMRTDGKIILKTNGKNNEFKGIIYSNGKIEFANSININGIMIAGNKCDGYIDVIELENGKNAGILIKDEIEVNITYNILPILNIYTENYILRRKLYDYLGITDYGSTDSASKIEDIEKLLKHLKIKTNSAISMNIDDVYKIKFSLSNLKYSN